MPWELCRGNSVRRGNIVTFVPWEPKIWFYYRNHFKNLFHIVQRGLKLIFSQNLCVGLKIIYFS